MRLRLPSVSQHLKWRGNVLAVLLALTVCVSRTPAEQQVLSAPAAPETPAAAETLAAPTAAISSMPSLADSGFWFLSTQHSPQSFDRCCPQFCPTVNRFEQCVGFRNSSLAELSGGLEPGVPVCIVIHGSFVDLESSCRESQQVWHWLRSAGMGQRMQMIYFSWPSFRRLTPMVQYDVNVLGRRAARNGYYLAELIQHIPPECPICLLGHSHGTRVISAGLHMLSGGAIQGVCHPFARAHGRRIRTVFAAAAVDHHWFNPGKRYDRALFSTECLLNLTNRIDPALNIYPLRMPLLAARPMGLTGVTRWDRWRLGSCGGKVLNYDVSRDIGRTHLWPYYFSNNRLAMIMRNYVYFPDCCASGNLAMQSGSADHQ
ncbi:MAG: alpha/beta hydrolase [Fuerstiella sp.]